MPIPRSTISNATRVPLGVTASRTGVSTSEYFAALSSRLSTARRSSSGSHSSARSGSSTAWSSTRPGCRAVNRCGGAIGELADARRLAGDRGADRHRAGRWSGCRRSADRSRRDRRRHRRARPSRRPDPRPRARARRGSARAGCAARARRRPSAGAAPGARRCVRSAISSNARPTSPSSSSRSSVARAVVSPSPNLRAADASWSSGRASRRENQTEAAPTRIRITAADRQHAAPREPGAVRRVDRDQRAVVAAHDDPAPGERPLVVAQPLALAAGRRRQRRIDVRADQDRRRCRTATACRAAAARSAPSTRRTPRGRLSDHRSTMYWSSAACGSR